MDKFQVCEGGVAPKLQPCKIHYNVKGATDGLMARKFFEHKSLTKTTTKVNTRTTLSINHFHLDIKISGTFGYNLLMQYNQGLHFFHNKVPTFA